jgi:hypothetical protein
VVLLKAPLAHKAKQAPRALLVLMALRAPQDRKATQVTQAPLVLKA